jgi:hypothetical protein
MALSIYGTNGCHSYDVTHPIATLEHLDWLCHTF